MPGYVAIAFLESSMTRVDRQAVDAPRPTAPGPATPTPIEDIRVVRSIASEQLRERGAAIGERKARLRRAWAQTTFYLFDPESWR